MENTEPSTRFTYAWNVSPREAIAVQKQLRDDVHIEPFAKSEKDIRLIAGADVSSNRFDQVLYAGIVVLSYPDLQTVDYAVHRAVASFPYIPGLLSFREIPALIECFAQLETVPDLIMVDGQGIAHPRRLGIAAHMGLVTDVPTIGVGKSRLFGSFAQPNENAGSTETITDPHTGEVIGTAFRSRVRANPLIISPGHRMNVADSLTLVQNTLRGYRLPEPTRRAHELVNAFRRGEI